MNVSSTPMIRAIKSFALNSHWREVLIVNGHVYIYVWHVCGWERMLAEPPEEFY